MEEYAVGFDFGSLSVRGLLVNVQTGEELCAAVYDYPHGIMSETLPDGTAIPQMFALQHPLDYLMGIAFCSKKLLRETGIAPEQIIGIGIDSTASTIMPVDDAGVPLCLKTEFQSNPQAWLKLWKHHGGNNQAKRLSEQAAHENTDWFRKYGGVISSEWFLPKAIELAETAPEVYPKSSVPFHTYNWGSSNRNERYFYDLYGSNSSGTMSASGASVQSTGTIIGNCPSCGKYSFQGVYVEVAHSSRGHANYNECNACHYVQYLGTYTTKSHGSGAYGSGTCPDCGSHTWVLQNEQAATCTSNGYRSYSCACGQTKSETIYSSGHSYSYGSWEQYSSSQHRRTGSCRNCGATDYDYASHSMSYGAWSNSSSSQHSRTATCRTCGYSTMEYGSHSYSTGSWSKYSDTQHRRSKTCSGCGASTYDYADHSYSYGSWVSDSETQHKRTKTCSACGDSGYEYADHTDTNGDGKCDDCGATVLLTVTWDAGSNGGTIDGKASFSETVKPNSKLTAPGSVPVKTGYTFKGWFTAKSGGSLYSTVTINSSTTFYAQFEANKYTVTWDLGTGQSETTEQTYGEKLVLPTEPTRKNAEFLGWFTSATGGAKVDSNTIYTTDGETTYYAHWEITEIFSATVPVVLPLTVDENGSVHTGTAEIINGSTGAVVVSSVSISTKNGWKLVPFDTDMAHAKVDAKQLGFKINDSVTTKNGDTEMLILRGPWDIAENGKLPISYDAVVSAVSQPVTEQEVLFVVFVLEWGGE